MNLVMSELVSVENVSNLEIIGSILGYKISSMPMKYLGLHLGASF